MIWIGIEIRMLRFLLVLIFSDLYQEHSNTVKYFSIQSLGSIILIRELKNAQNSSNNDKIRHSSIPPVVYKSYEKD